MRRQRTTHLRSQFGPEYERAVEETGARSKAEADFLHELSQSGLAWQVLAVAITALAVLALVLIAGTTQPSPTSKTINEALPQIVNFGAYPTTIYLGRDGRVRSVHAGFASPATGAEHVRLKQELRELTERLLAEPCAA
jgi:hypothetical protein